jgi:hypothetical protein
MLGAWRTAGEYAMPQVEVFTPAGVVSGATARATVGTDARGQPQPLPVDASRWYPLDGSAAQRRGAVTVPADEILVVILAAPPFTIHASWYPIELDMGPYHIEARLPTAPGFDPARALARPTGAYVALRDLSISLPGRPEAGAADRAWGHVNRYAVERVRSNLMLGFFFPGATFEPLNDRVGGLPVPMARGAQAV